MSFSRFVLTVGLAVFGTLVACSRGDSSVVVGSGVNDQGFIPPDAGDSSAPDATAALCVSTVCPAPWATCAAADGTLPPYACATNLNRDLQNCGSCGSPCRSPSPNYNVHMECISGQCQALCNADVADCNGIPDDGCEANTLEDPANCGLCGAACPAGVACIKGKCGCPGGTTLCGDNCVDLATSDLNCGACGVTCGEGPTADGGTPPPHMYLGCKLGQCTDLRCVHNASEFWADCNGALAVDGCEVDLRSDTSHCGSCGNVCDPGQRCFDAAGVVECQCTKGQTLCDERPGSPAACVDTEDDPRNCGACGYVCPYVPNAVPACKHGRCKSACLPGTADCNGRDDDGCEIDLKKDPRNCGACGASCDVAQGQPCVDGVCATRDCSGQATK